MIQGTDMAFPDPVRADPTCLSNRQVGMDLRTYMATQFMAANIADERIFGSPLSERAKESVRAADALIAELNKNPEIKPW